MPTFPLPTFQEAFFQLSQKLKALYQPEEAKNIADIMIESVSGMTHSERIIYPEKRFSETQWLQWQKFEKELLNNRPLQYVLGTTQFYGLNLKVDESTLIPRPETEELVDFVLKETKAISKDGAGINILDIGTGSGCIALALKANLPQATVWAADLSETILNTAQENAQNNHIQIVFFQWDVLQQQPPATIPKLDIIISNPPYITVEEKNTLASNVLDFEPHEALFVTNNDPLQFYKRIEGLSHDLLQPKGKVFLELHEQFATATESYFMGKGWKTVLKKDFQGKERMLKATKCLTD